MRQSSAWAAAIQYLRFLERDLPTAESNTEQNAGWHFVRSGFLTHLNVDANAHSYGPANASRPVGFLAAESASSG